jgi:hypothetical protein
MDSSSAAMDALLNQFERVQRSSDLVQTLHERQVKEVPARYILPSDRRPSRPLQVPQSLPVRHRSTLQDCQTISPSIPGMGFLSGLIAITVFAFLSLFSVDYPTNLVIVWPSDLMGFQLFLKIINHDIPLSLLESVKRVSQEFFDLPLE